MSELKPSLFEKSDLADAPIAGVKTLKPALPPLLKLALEIGPLVVFFLANQRFGIVNATGIFVVVTLLSLGIHYVLVRHLPIMPLVSAFVVTVFGGLTLFFQDETFIKIKPTIVNSLFGLVLLGGLFFNKSFLMVVLDSVFQISEEGWRKLTFRFALFFFFLAGLNEFVWRVFTTDQWVNFKVFGTMPLTMLFMIAQFGLIKKYSVGYEGEGR